MIIYVYQNDKIIAGVPAPSLEKFYANPKQYYSKMPEGFFIASEFKYDYPIIEGNTVRNKEREERILLDNETELLLPGEYIEGDKIIYKECPTDLYSPKWISPNWTEGSTLEEAKEIKRIELKKSRDEGIYAPYLYSINGYFYDSDLDSRNRLFQAQQLGVGINVNIDWITADNQISSVSNEDLNSIVNGIALREQQLFSKFSNKYNQVLNSTNVEEVKTINWE